MRFSRQQMTDFAEASHDRNPLHRDERYASRTPFGETVVFGMAGVLAALGAWARGRRFSITSLTAEFRQPLFAEAEYALDESEQEQKVTLRILDGTTVKAVIELAWSVPEQSVAAGRARSTFEPRASAAEWAPAASSDMRLEARGYETHRPAVDRLSPTFGDIATLLPASQLDALLWASYVVGMEVPGRQALFSECQLDFRRPVQERFTEPDLIATFDPRFGLATLTGGGGGLASVKLKAFVRPPRPQLEADRIVELVGREPSLAGKVAAVTGSSRGLGAALAVALAARGADLVINARANEGDLAVVAGAARALGATTASSIGDLLTAAGCADLRNAATTAFGRADYLICSASGPIRKAAFGELSSERLRGAVGDAVELVRGPLDALRSVLAPAATIVCISSEYATAPPAGFAHYAAAKSAVEGLARGLAPEFPALRFVVVRPRRLLTDQTNTSGIPQKLPSAAEVAAEIVRALCALPPAPGVHVIE